ncbi:hypothetical protein QFZ28_000171 [Neobacillus niacini]|uniref:hypothetical protein n=1 Tax=Neobacillus niacini TaxID=86668 RepID=UPI00277D733D|nr:hypothetical protein [Neobacillus niacini]MDQ0999771.1 hypothetical protein [Neobacillus niacini]
MIQLLNAQNQVVREFENLKACREYCVANKICNEGWVKRSVKTGERIYQDTKPYKDYTGYGYKVVKI